MNGYPSSLAPLFSSRRDIQARMRDGWLETSILAIDTRDERLDAFEREFLTRLGNRLYGEKPSRPDSNVRRLRP